MGQLEVAQEVWNYLVPRGWSQQAVGALLGNMEYESGIVPDRWEGDIVGNMSGGYGLVQWTPATKIFDYCSHFFIEPYLVSSQCRRLEYEVENNEQFYSTEMSFYDFKVSKRSPEELAEIFVRCYERPYDVESTLAGRKAQARYWYELLKSGNPEQRVQVVDWFNKNRGKITYSMEGSRIGTDGTADCSGSITVAVYEATGYMYDYVYSTVTLHDYLTRAGYEYIWYEYGTANKVPELLDEDIIILSSTMGTGGSVGGAGHTGVISGGGKYLTSTCYYTQGETGTAIQDFDFNLDYMLSSGLPYYEVWRPKYTGVPIPPPVEPEYPELSTVVKYSMHLLNGDWLPEVTNFNNVNSDGFAGLPFNSHDMLHINVASGDIRYRVHTAESGWLDYVYAGDPTDPINGCAGNPGEAIDGVQIYYETEDGHELSQCYYRAQTIYRYGWLGTCCDEGTSVPGYDGWAGMFGEPIDRLQVAIAPRNPLY